MKKLLFSLSLLASLAAVAGESSVDVSAQVYGVMPISSTATELIVCVPWVAAANTETNSISVAEIIKTDNLTAGDWIRVWDDANSKFKVWTLSGGQWVASTTVDGQGVSKGTASDATYLKRGDAIVLYRANASNQPLFHVQGQYSSSAVGSTTCAKRSGDTAAYTLLAPPSTTAIKLSDITWDSVGEADYLVIKGGDKLVYHDNAWSVYSAKKVSGKWQKVWTEYTDDIPVGTGFWYVANTKDVSACPTVNWSK